MDSRRRRVQPLMAFAAGHLDEDLSLPALAARARYSRFHLQRVFSAAARETVKQYTLRLRLERAAAQLVGTTNSVLSVALTSGFRNHETFCRAFQRRFGMTPTAFRRRGLGSDATAATTASHVTRVTGIGPCIRLFHTCDSQTTQEHVMPYAVSRKELAQQPVLVVRRRVKRGDIAAVLGEQFGRIWQYAMRAGATVAGQPFTRYLDWGPGMLTLEMGLPIATATAGEADIRSDTLPGGPAAVVTHTGPYDRLSDAHAAVQIWVEENGFRAAGAPWETYVSDPADVPDQKDWQTEICWPLER